MSVKDINCRSGERYALLMGSSRNIVIPGASFFIFFIKSLLVVAQYTVQFPLLFCWRFPSSIDVFKIGLRTSLIFLKSKSLPLFRWYNNINIKRHNFRMSDCKSRKTRKQNESLGRFIRRVSKVFCRHARVRWKLLSTSSRGGNQHRAASHS